MADAMKLVPVERLQYAIDAIAHLQPHKARRELEKLLAASPPAREEAPAEGAGDEWKVRLDHHLDWMIKAGQIDREAGGDGKSPLIVTSLYHLAQDAIHALALRNRTSEPEAGAVGVVCGTAQADMHTADLPVGTKLFTHPAPATADKLRGIIDAATHAALPPVCVVTGNGTKERASIQVESANRIIAALNEQPQ